MIAAMACGAMATTSAERIRIEFVLDVDRERKIDEHKNQNAKMHTHIYHTFGADSKALNICGMQ